jgi:flagellar basal body rod protein FlgG
MNGLYVAASGAAAQIAGLDTKASNLANIATPGFRRILDVVQSVAAGGSSTEYASLGAAAQLDMSQGPLKATGDPLDIAITGPAFLVVETPDGPAYTRNGQLQVAPDGQLLAAGYPLTRDGGGTITLTPGPVTFATDGTISVNVIQQGKLALADPNAVALAPIGGSLYRSIESDSLPPAAPGSQVHQGFIEGSTGSEMDELVGMMGVMRNYEAAMKAVTTIDQNQDKTIQTFTLQA